jgi:cupin 2 domain-containing protein
MRIRPINLFAPLPAEEAGAERFVPLLQGGGFRLEHIVSHGRASEPGFWYDQAEDEWVALLRGRATLIFEPEETMSLTAGDALLIPARRRHRVAATSPDAVWLALHARAGGERA